MRKILCTAALFVFTGCQVAGDTGVHAVQPRDIPVPQGMTLRTHLHQSNTLEVGEYRYANLVYEGSTSPLQVTDYLLKRMPQHSYRLVSQERAGDDGERLVFQRGPYTSTCTVRNIQHRTRLEIQLRTHPNL